MGPPPLLVVDLPPLLVVDLPPLLVVCCPFMLVQAITLLVGLVQAIPLLVGLVEEGHGVQLFSPPVHQAPLGVRQSQKARHRFRRASRLSWYGKWRNCLTISRHACKLPRCMVCLKYPLLRSRRLSDGMCLIFLGVV